MGDVGKTTNLSFCCILIFVPLFQRETIHSVPPMVNKNTREEQVKNYVAEEWFAAYDCKNIIKNLDFCVAQKRTQKQIDGGFPLTSYYWAEAKRGRIKDIYQPIVQLLLTIGKERPQDTHLPPAFVGAFDEEKIVFIPYATILPILNQNDFNWNVPPSDYTTKEFVQLYKTVQSSIEKESLCYYYADHQHALRTFITQNFSKSTSKIEINRNNFISIYQLWRKEVYPSIDITLEELQELKLIDADFYIADLFTQENETIGDKLFVLLEQTEYSIGKIPQTSKRRVVQTLNVLFKDSQRAHHQFWLIYQRPPEAEYRDYIIERRDLLVPPDLRERKGSFFTPQEWVTLSQEYLAKAFGKNWQSEYYVWDCAAGTGNLLNGLTEKSRIWASTLDPQDVRVMHERIANGNATNLVPEHVFQFDFLNEPFSKLPESLQKVLNDPKKQSKLVIYINPPYAEAGNARTRTGARNKNEVATTTQVWKDYGAELGLGIRELFAQFMIRIKKEIPACKIAMFSTAKYIQGAGFEKFRAHFLAKFNGGFVVPAYTFDNVDGNFPIAFAIWDLRSTAPIRKCVFDVYGAENVPQHKTFGVLPRERITDWITRCNLPSEVSVIGYTGNHGPDFQNNRMLQISNKVVTHIHGTRSNATKYPISASNLIPMAVYFAVRLCMEQTWLNDRDQFLSPKCDWKRDLEFQNNCLTFALFSPKNNIQSQLGTNYWIPFTEREIGAHDEFDSHFMTDFMRGQYQQAQKMRDNGRNQLLDHKKNGLKDLVKEESFIPTQPLIFSEEATAVFDAGRELWQYYHTQLNANPNASYYDIREYFQGRNEKGRMNPTSEDAEYNRLHAHLKEVMSVLADAIATKVYEYGFLVS